MSELSATNNLHNNLPLQAHDSRAGLRATSGNSEQSQNAALFQSPGASNSTVLDIQPAVGMPADADTHAKHILSFIGGQ